MRQVTALTLLSQRYDVRVLLKEGFAQTLRSKILRKYGTLKGFANKSQVPNDAVVNWFSTKHRRTNPPLPVLLRIIKDLKIKQEELLKNIQGFSSWGGHHTVNVKNLQIDSHAATGVGLYVGDGYLSKKLPRIVFTNTNPEITKFFTGWLKKVFGVKKSQLYFAVYLDRESEEGARKIFGLENCYVKFYRNTNPNVKLSCKVILNDAVFRKLFDSLINYIKSIALRNKELAVAYLQGLFAAEGCVYLQPAKTPQIFIEMKNGEEIAYLERLLKFLNINFRKYKRPKERTKICVFRKREVQKLKLMKVAYLHPQKLRKMLSINYPVTV